MHKFPLHFFVFFFQNPSKARVYVGLKFYKKFYERRGYSSLLDLFYGNYMLSHNMNPIDGANHPEEKQVYSSAMMKSLQRKGIRKPNK